MSYVDFLKQTAVYWGNPQPTGIGGYTFDDPVEIVCRWSIKQKLFVDNTGRERLSAAIVYVNQDLDREGYLYLGELADLSSAPTPANTDDALMIRRFDKSPDRRVTRFVRKAWLTA